MRRVSSLLRFILRKGMEDPDSIIILIEILPNEEPIELTTDDYTITKYGKKHIEFDSLTKFDGEKIFSVNFEFLRSINKNFVNNKIKIDKNLLGVNKIKTTIRRTMRKIDFDLEDSILNIYICDTDSAKIKKKIRYTIVSFDDDVLKLEDLDGYDEEINLGRE